jgi:hypothetical protein
MYFVVILGSIFSPTHMFVFSYKLYLSLYKRSVHCILHDRTIAQRLKFYKTSHNETSLYTTNNGKPQKLYKNRSMNNDKAQRMIMNHQNRAQRILM